MPSIKHRARPASAPRADRSARRNCTCDDVTIGRASREDRIARPVGLQSSAQRTSARDLAATVPSIIVQDLPSKIALTLNTRMTGTSSANASIALTRPSPFTPGNSRSAIDRVIAAAGAMSVAQLGPRLAVPARGDELAVLARRAQRPVRAARTGFAALFEPFGRGAAGRGGSGLGLAIARCIGRQHGGVSAAT
jgi:hypothetical protein